MFRNLRRLTLREIRRTNSLKCCGCMEGGGRKRFSLSRPGDSVQGRNKVPDHAGPRPANKLIIAKILGIRPDDVIKTPLRLLDEENAVRTYAVLKEFGFPSSAVLAYPDLMMKKPGAVENYIRIMQESCFPNISETFILQFRIVCHQTLPALQMKASLPDVETVLASYCLALGENNAFMNQLIDSLPDDKERITLFALRCHTIVSYLCRMSIGSMEEMRKAFKTYPRISYRSLNWIKRTLNVLKDNNYSVQKIMKHSYLLHGDPNNIERILQIKTLGGLEMTSLSHSRPKVLMSAYDTLISIEKSLKDNGIPLESIQKYPEVFTLSSKTIEKRLQEMDEIPEFSIFKTHPRAARLLYYQTKAKSRLDEFRNMQVSVPSLHLLSTDNKRFTKTMSSGDLRMRGCDIVFYLSEKLQVEKKRIRASLNRHPHWIHIRLMTLKSNLNYIQTLRNFSLEELIDALPILLYPEDKVKAGVDDVLVSGESSLTDAFFLQMVLYHLERPVHFTGDAVWNKMASDDDHHDAESEPSEESKSENEIRH